MSVSTGLILYILLFPYNPNSCNMPGCLVMHYPIPEHIEVFTDISKANQRLSKGVRAYEYFVETNELRELEVKALYNVQPVEVVSGFEIKKSS